MNRKQLAFLPDDIPLRLGPPIRTKPKVEVTPAPPFMVEALERIEDSADAAERIRQQRIDREMAKHLRTPQPTHGSVSVVINESTHGSVSVVINESTPVNSFVKVIKKGIAAAEQSKEFERRRGVMETMAKKYMGKAGLAAAKEVVRRWSPTGRLIGIPDDKIEDAIRDFKAGLDA